LNNRKQKWATGCRLQATKELAAWGLWREAATERSKR